MVVLARGRQWRERLGDWVVTRVEWWDAQGYHIEIIRRKWCLSVRP